MSEIHIMRLLTPDALSMMQMASKDREKELGSMEKVIEESHFVANKMLEAGSDAGDGNGLVMLVAMGMAFHYMANEMFSESKADSKDEQVN